VSIAAMSRNNGYAAQWLRPADGTLAKPRSFISLPPHEVTHGCKT
jgi:hypothetical protein